MWDQLLVLYTTIESMKGVRELRNMHTYIFKKKNRDKRDFRRSAVQETVLCGNKFQYVRLVFSWDCHNCWSDLGIQLWEPSCRHLRSCDSIAFKHLVPFSCFVFQTVICNLWGRKKPFLKLFLKQYPNVRILIFVHTGVTTFVVLSNIIFCSNPNIQSMPVSTLVKN